MKLMVTDMGESNKHKVLVEYALRFIKDSVGEELSYFIETDINDGRPLPQLTMEGVRDIIGTTKEKPQFSAAFAM